MTKSAMEFDRLPNARDGVLAACELLYRLQFVERRYQLLGAISPGAPTEALETPIERKDGAG